MVGRWRALKYWCSSLSCTSGPAQASCHLYFYILVYEVMPCLYVVLFILSDWFRQFYLQNAAAYWKFSIESNEIWCRWSCVMKHWRKPNEHSVDADPRTFHFQIPSRYNPHHSACLYQICFGAEKASELPQQRICYLRFQMILRKRLVDVTQNPTLFTCQRPCGERQNELLADLHHLRAAQCMPSRRCPILWTGRMAHEQHVVNYELTSGNIS